MHVFSRTRVYIYRYLIFLAITSDCFHILYVDLDRLQDSGKQYGPSPLNEGSIPPQYAKNEHICHIVHVGLTCNMVMFSPVKHIVNGPDRPPVHHPPPPPQERMRSILFCFSWDLSEHEKWMPPSPNWDGLPVGRHFQNGHHRN